VVRTEIRVSFERPQVRNMISTGSEENFVEITGKYFTKLLQTHTYNTLHT
jgi:prophage maintenance system killer protein